MPSSGVQTCALDRKSTRLNSSHDSISYAVFCLKQNKLTSSSPPPQLHRYSPSTHTPRIATSPPPHPHLTLASPHPHLILTASSFFFNDTATAEIPTPSLHHAPPI